MEALNVPLADTPVVTFWEGEIVDAKNYTFFTGKWEASPEDDIRHWSKFPSFTPLLVFCCLSSCCERDPSPEPQHQPPYDDLSDDGAGSSSMPRKCLLKKGKGRGAGGGDRGMPGDGLDDWGEEAAGLADDDLDPEADAANKRKYSRIPGMPLLVVTLRYARIFSQGKTQIVSNSAYKTGMEDL
ncbi:hypothetical protein DAI22_01g030500 [Oryza sativa Japonica Group]|nr:hypothetical protein DAI22_01g030500 [Oryza sativa Japonica Group]